MGKRDSHVVSVLDSRSGISLEKMLEQIWSSKNSQSLFRVPKSLHLSNETSHRWPGFQGSSSGCLT